MGGGHAKVLPERPQPGESETRTTALVTSRKIHLTGLNGFSGRLSNGRRDYKGRVGSAVGPVPCTRLAATQTRTSHPGRRQGGQGASPGLDGGECRSVARRLGERSSPETGRTTADADDSSFNGKRHRS